MPQSTTERRREYIRKYQNDWIKRRRLDWLKNNGPCRECGSWEALEVDHVDPSKKISHRIWSWSENRREAELAKCQVLCETCHKKKSDAAMRSTLRHGVWQRYKKGCRCRLCTACWAIRIRLVRIKTTAKFLGTVVGTATIERRIKTS